MVFRLLEHELDWVSHVMPIVEGDVVELAESSDGLDLAMGFFFWLARDIGWKVDVDSGQSCFESACDVDAHLGGSEGEG